MIFRRFLLFLLLITSLLHWPAFTQEERQEQNQQESAPPPALITSNDDRLLVVIIGLLLVQTVLIGGLLRSRMKFKEAEEKLRISQKVLEEKVVERTDKLRTINNQLYEEIAKHEITEELLQETQDYLQSVINSMPSILIGVTREGTITQWNSAATRSTGIYAEEALGKNISSLSESFKIDVDLVHNAIDQGVTQVKEAVVTETNGEMHYADWIVYPLLSTDISGAVIRIDDVTMRVRFENMMIQNEKMMSLGELAAGMAHEINNPLSAILHGVQNIHRRTTANLPSNIEIAEKHNITLEQLKNYLEERGIYKFLDDIRDAGERSAHIVTNMLEFSRTSNLKLTPVDITQLLEQSLELAINSYDMQYSVGSKRLDIQRQYQDDLPLVPCSAAEIQQVFINIIRNAAQSFNHWPSQGKGRPAIVLGLSATDKEVCISIKDNGPGMTEVTKRHLFEPFFTTKEVGKGTGLGLSVSYFIVTEHHHGKIEVDSNEGNGATFRIKLPLATDQIKAGEKSLEKA